MRDEIKEKGLELPKKLKANNKIGKCINIEESFEMKP